MPTEAGSPRADDPQLRRCRVLVVVPVLNESAHLDAVLHGLLAERAKLDALRVVVVDGGSTDGTVDIATRWAAAHTDVHLVHNPRRIQSAGINLAVRRFGGDADVLIRCDAHASYPPDYCHRLLESLERTAADAVVVPLDSYGDRAVQRAVALASNSPVGTGGSAHRAGRKSGFVDHGHHAAFRLRTFVRAGGYDETFTHNEDAELDCRQRKLGFRIYLDATIRVGYRPRATMRALWSQYFRYGAGRARTVRRHPGTLRLRQLAVPLNLLLLVVTLAASPWLPLLLAWPALYLGVLTAVSVHLAVRARTAVGLLVAPAALVMHTAWACGFLWSLLLHGRGSSWPSPVVATSPATLERG